MLTSVRVVRSERSCSFCFFGVLQKTATKHAHAWPDAESSTQAPSNKNKKGVRQEKKAPGRNKRKIDSGERTGNGKCRKEGLLLRDQVRAFTGYHHYRPCARVYRLLTPPRLSTTARFGTKRHFHGMVDRVETNACIRKAPAPLKGKKNMVRDHRGRLTSYLPQSFWSVYTRQKSVDAITCRRERRSSSWQRSSPTWLGSPRGFFSRSKPKSTKKGNIFFLFIVHEAST